MSSINVVQVVVQVDDVPEELLQEPVNIPTLTTDDNPCFNEDCVICFDSINDILQKGNPVVEFQCKHQLCRVCAVEYLTNQLKHGLDITCPICRYMLLSSQSEQFQKSRQSLQHFMNQNPNNDTPEIIEQRRQRVNMDIHERRQRHINQRMSANRQRARKQILLSLPCLIIAIAVFAIIGLYHSGAFK